MAGVGGAGGGGAADLEPHVPATAEEEAALAAMHKVAVTFEADKPMSAEDVELLRQLRSAVAGVRVPEGDEYWSTDHALHRFLLARKRVVADAAHMYRETMAFRETHRCATVLTTYAEPMVMRRFFPWGIVGLDKEGFPVLVERVGKIDLIGMNAAVGREEFLNWVCWYHEMQETMMRRLSRRAGRDRHRVIAVIDLAGLSLRHISSGTLSVLKSRTRLEEDNYPEVVKRVFLINTPSMFATVWGVVKLFMDQGTVDKLQILGSNYMPTLLQYMDASVIPKSLGGTLVDETGDPECRALIGPGGIVPLSYLVNVGTDGHGLGEEVTVSAGKHGDVVLRVPPGATVRWQWGMADKDVQFSVTVREVADAAVPIPAGVVDVTTGVCGVHLLASASRAPSAAVHSAATVGDVHAPLPGVGAGPEVVVCAPIRQSKAHGHYTAPAACHAFVRLRWDNSYSWLTGKTLVRRVDVLLPGQGEASEGVVREEDPLEAYARSRARHMDVFGTV